MRSSARCTRRTPRPRSSARRWPSRGAAWASSARPSQLAAAASSLRLRLQLDTAAYKDAVAQLRELKPQIGELQQQMQTVQQQLEADFAAWHACATVAAAAGSSRL